MPVPLDLMLTWIIRRSLQMGALLKACWGGGPPTKKEGFLPDLKQQIFQQVEEFNAKKAEEIKVEDRTPVFDQSKNKLRSLREAVNLTSAKLDNNISKERNLRQLIIDWTNFLLPFAAVLAVVALVWAGFLYISGFQDEARIETAKKIFVWATIGLLLIFASYAIVNTLIKGVA